MTSAEAAIEALLDDYDRFMQLVSVGHAPDLLELSLSMAQLKALYVLWGREMRMSELAAVLGVSISTVSELVERMVDAGLLSRREDPTDRRHVMVAVTPLGIERLGRFRELGRRQFRALVADLGRDDIAHVHRSIQLLTQAALRKESS